MDANLLHISFEGRHLEDPNAEAEEAMWRWTVSPEAAPDSPEYIDIGYLQGDPVSINGQAFGPAAMLTELNRLGGKHGIGRLDLVENRSVGMKSRGCYETPGGTIMLKGHRGIESITLDREVAHLKGRSDATLCRADLQRLLVESGTKSPAGPDRPYSEQRVRHGAAQALQRQRHRRRARDSDLSLFDKTIATFDDDGGAFDQKDAGGFIKLNALRLRIAELARRRRA